MTSRMCVRLGAAAVAAAAIGGMLTVAQPAAQAAPSYQNSFIAFGGFGAGWWVVNPDGSNQHTVTPSGGGYDPATLTVNFLKYSPDGTHVAFATGGGLGTDFGIWVADADGSNAHKLSDLSSDTFHPGPAWSPDSKVVYYSSNGQIQQDKADGTGTPTPAFTDAGSCTDSAPQVTHNGYIYFYRNCKPESNGQSYGWAIHRPGDPLPTPTGGQGYQFLSVISPDGTRVAEDWPPAPPPGSHEDLHSVAVLPINLNTVPTPTVELPSGHTMDAQAFGPSGDIVYADGYSVPQGSGSALWKATIQIVPDAVHQTPRTVTTVVSTKPDYQVVQFVDWVNGPANFGSRPVADRVGGADRIATSIAASKWTYDDKNGKGRKASSAVLARSDTFADALGGTALAVQNNGPLLLTPTGSLDKNVEAELTRILQPHSVVYVLGGTSALSPAVANRLTALGFSVQRLAGDNRYATAVAVATQIAGYGPDSVLVATGIDYPDALAAGVAAGQLRYTGEGLSDSLNGGVVLLTDGTAMPKETAAYLAQIDPHRQHVYAVGGQAVKAVSAAFPSWTGVTPLAGANRFETAAKVAASPLFGSGAAGRYSMVGVATAGNWPDALSGGALIGNQGGPLLLADASGTPGSQSAIVSGAHLKGIVVFGGTSVVTNGALTSIADNAFGTGTWDADVDRDAPPLP